MLESQSQDLKIAFDELSKAINNTESLKLQLDTTLALAKYQAEEIARLTKYLKAVKRVRIASAIISGTGLAFIGASRIPGVEENWQQTLLITGIGLTASGVATFGVSFTIPF